MPSDARLRQQFVASDQHEKVSLPEPTPLQTSSRDLERALREEDAARVRAVGRELLGMLAEHYKVDAPKLAVLGIRPHRTTEGRLSYELFGDYTPGKQTIRVWMRTAILGKVTSHRGLLNTLLHEFCHHLDIDKLGYEDSPHTRGFYARIDELYHLALATPPERRKPLAWRRRGSVWHIDWAKMRTATRR